MARKGRARRFREARELKRGFDDGLFEDSGRSLADAEDEEEGEDAEPRAEWDDWDEQEDEQASWDPDVNPEDD